MEQPRYYDSPVNALAREIAKTFGGTTGPIGADNEYFEGGAEVKVAACDPVPAYVLGLDMRGYGAQKGRLTVRLGPARRCADVCKRFDWPKASFDSKRPLQSLLADIGRRVVNAPRAVALLQEWEAECNAVDARTSAVAEKANALLARFPSLFPSQNYPFTTYEARLFGPGVEVRVGANCVTFDRVGSLPHENAERVLVAILGDRKAETALCETADFAAELLARAVDMAKADNRMNFAGQLEEARLRLQANAALVKGSDNV